MKQITLFLIFFLKNLYAFSQIPTAGLIGAWTFSGNANDIVGVNHGTVVGATLTFDRCGNPNSAYNFDGTNDYIVMAVPGPTGTVSRSVAFWAKTGYTGLNPVSAFAYGTSSGNGAFAIQYNYNCIGVGVDVNNQALTRGNSCVANNVWHHVVAVLNSTLSTQIGQMLFYVNGVLLPTISCNVGGTVNVVNTGNALPVTIGKVANAMGRFFNGDLDDFYLYDRALTAQEVLQLYNATSCSPPIVGNTTLCPGSIQTYSTLPYNNATYTWTLPNGWTGTSTTNIINTIASFSSGVISVTASNFSCGIFPTATLAVNVLNPNFMSVVPSHTNICSGSGVTITLSGATSYTTNIPGLMSNTVVVFPNATTTYTVSGSNSTCTHTTALTLSVSSLPTISISSNSVACNGQTIVLSASGAQNYTWFPGALVGTTYTDAPSSLSTYSVVGSVNNCTAMTMYMLPVPPALTLSTASNFSSICLGNVITHSALASGGAGGYSYAWTPGSSNAVTHTTSEANAGNYIYTVTATDINSCSISSTIGANYFVGATLTAANPSVCPNTLATLTVSGAVSYTWLPSGFVGSTQTVSPFGPFSHTVFGTAVTGCTALISPSVFIKAAPSLSFNTYSITCGSLGSATVYASGGTGPFSYTWTPGFHLGPTASSLFPGTYTVHVLDGGTGCVFTPTTNFAPLIPLTGTVSSSASNLCFGVPTGSASISLAGGSGAQSYIWSSITTQTTATVSTLSAGVNTVSVTDSLTFCNVTHTFFIAQPNEFSLTIAASAPSVCLGSNITLSATVLGGTPSYTYSWRGGPVSNTLFVNRTLSGVYPYTIDIVDANNCSATDSIVLAFVDNPTVSVNSVSICPLETGTLIAAGASSYSWNIGTTINPMTASPTVTTIYTVVGTALACTASATGSIVVKSPPNALINGSTTICQGNTLSLFAGSAQNYNWTGPSGFSTSLQSASIAIAQPSNSGVYSLTVTATNACTASIATSVTVNSIPFLTASAGTVCQGSPLVLVANFLNGASYQWVRPGYASSLQSPTIPNAPLSASGNYTITLTSAQGCTNSAVVTASVVTLPIVTVAGPNSVCFNSAVTFSASGAGNYSWLGPNNFYSVLQSPTISNVTFQSSGVYTLSAFQGPCSVTVVKNLLVHALPTSSPQSNSPVCENTNILLSTAAASSYTWSGPNNFIQNTQNVTIANASISKSGVYSLTVRNANFCTGTNTLLINILAAPKPTVNGAAVCIGTRANLSASGGATYAWTGPANFAASGTLATISVVNASNTGIYTVVVSGENNCKTAATTTLSAILFPLPTPQITGQPKVCINDVLRLNASGGSSYEWRGPSEFYSNQSFISISASNTVIAGVYTVNVKDQNNCLVSSTVNVSVHQLPKAILSSSHNNACVPYCTTLQVNSESGSTQIANNNFVIGDLNLAGTKNKFCFDEAGSYIVRADYRDINNCINSTTLLVVAQMKPIADFGHSPLTPLAGVDQVLFYNNSVVSGQHEWNWFFERSDSVASSQKNPAYLFNKAGSYPVTLIVKNNFGCADTMIKTITISDDFGLYVPNSFTPNGDGLNDIFLPKGGGTIEYHLEIFNRWGQRIFESKDFNAGWDGTFNGHECKVETYAWKITSKDAGGKFRSITGNVNLIR